MRKRRTTTKRRTTRRNVVANPRRRRRPVARRTSSRRRYRNPRSTGMLAKGMALAAGAALIQFTLTFVPPIGGVSPLADAARTAATGWGLGLLMQRTGFGKTYADDVMLAGFTLAGGKLISSFILPFANRLFRPTQPPSEVPAGNGVQGIALINRGLQPFGAYNGGMSGIAVIDPAIHPMGEYAN